ncbi:MAG: Na+/H+ antiporter NhaC family protein, partial [Clostridia bacterium]|nr:Na+/H+ antiporter NhaC family protein [Clostridia bacterium]
MKGKFSIKTLAVLAIAFMLLMTMSVVAFAEDGAEVEYSSRFYSTALSLLPPVIAIALALITKEVYSSLFVGILVGGGLYAVGPDGFSFETMFNTIMTDGFIGKLADTWNMGIIIFLVVLGVIVVLMNKAGGSRAYGEWAKKKIKSRKGA